MSKPIPDAQNKIIQYEFNGVAKQTNIFRGKNLRSLVFVTEEIKGVIEISGLTGLSFKLVG